MQGFGDIRGNKTSFSRHRSHQIFDVWRSCHVDELVTTTSVITVPNRKMVTRRARSSLNGLKRSVWPSSYKPLCQFQEPGIQEPALKAI